MRSHGQFITITTFTSGSHADQNRQTQDVVCKDCPDNNVIMNAWIFLPICIRKLDFSSGTGIEIGNVI